MNLLIKYSDNIIYSKQLYLTYAFNKVTLHFSTQNINQPSNSNESAPVISLNSDHIQLTICEHYG